MDYKKLENGLSEEDLDSELEFLRLRRDKSPGSPEMAKKLYDNAFGRPIRSMFNHLLNQGRRIDAKKEYDDLKAQFWEWADQREERATQRKEDLDAFWRSGLGTRPPNAKNRLSLKRIVNCFARDRIKELIK
jgi:hypothetical protein